MANTLSRAMLEFADFTGANLNRANLMRADLSATDFSGADLSHADLTGADLRDARLLGITGRDTIRGLATSKNLDTALFD